MITPAAIAGQQFYKVGEWVTFAWNYTSLSVTPSAVDVLATCTANQATYTLAVNQSVQETGVVLWDTGAYQSTASVPLLTNMYTLIIYDSNGSPTDTPRAGYLGAYKQFIFGMYTPQPYVPLKGSFLPQVSFLKMNGRDDELLTLWPQTGHARIAIPTRAFPRSRRLR